jgi:hypothetical protein
VIRFTGNLIRHRKAARSIHYKERNFRDAEQMRGGQLEEVADSMRRAQVKFVGHVAPYPLDLTALRAAEARE